MSTRSFETAKAWNLKPRRYRLPALPHVEIWAAGDGPPLILLPGWGLSGFAYRRTMSAFATLGRRVVVPTLALGHGSLWSLEAATTIAAQVAASFDADPAPIVGHSFGGAVAVAYTAERPEMVSSLVLVDAVGVSPGRKHLAKLAIPGRQWRVGANVPTAMSLLRGALVPGGWASLVGSARWIFTQSLEQEFVAIRSHDVPRIVLWAENESVLPLTAGKQLASALGCPFHIVRARKDWTDSRKPDHDWPVRAPMFFARRVLHHMAMLESAPGESTDR